MTPACTVPLSQVAALNPRLRQSLSDETQVSFVPMAAVSAEEAKVTLATDRPYAEVRKGYTNFESGDVLVAKITPCFENGKIAEAVLPRQVGFGSTEFHVVRPKPGVLDGRYLHHYLRQGRIRVEGERRMTGSGGQRRVPEDFLAQLGIPLPPLPQQRRIAAILDQADALRTKRREALAQLESLTQSIFIEMTRQSDFGVRRMRIEDAMAAIIDYRGKTPTKTNAGVPLVTARVVKNGELLAPNEYIAEEDYKAWMRRGLPMAGDVLFTTEAPLGEVAQLDGRRVALAQRLLLLRGKPELLNNTYLRFAMTSQAVRSQIEARATGSTVKGIRQSELREVEIPVPPLETQDMFAGRVCRLEVLRKCLRDSAAELDALFASLQHRAFTGLLS